ncbi:MAG: hypothetical protein ACKVY0_10170 [Prosthecobacter sp.]
MPKHFFTNHGPQTLLAKSEGVFSSNKDLSAFVALVGCLRSSGWFANRPSLEHADTRVAALYGLDAEEKKPVKPAARRT